MGGKDSNSTADELNKGTLVDINAPANPAKKGSNKQSRNRAANDDSPALMGLLRE
jgi:hypothetical protein